MSNFGSIIQDMQVYIIKFVHIKIKKFLYIKFNIKKLYIQLLYLWEGNNNIKVICLYAWKNKPNAIINLPDFYIKF